jgi:hypothetical protein
LHCGSETFAACKVEDDNLVLRDAIEIAIRTKAQTTRFAKFGRPVGRKDAHKASVFGIVFTDRRDGVCRSEGVFARSDNVAVRADRKI